MNEVSETVFFTYRFNFSKNGISNSVIIFLKLLLVVIALVLILLLVISLSLLPLIVVQY